MANIHIDVTSDDFNITAEMNKITQSRTDIGALVSFTGFVRDNHNGKTIKKLTLEHFPLMAEKQLRTIANEAAERWDVTDITLIHRYGALIPSDQIVLVLTSSPHRSDAFSAGEFMMDWLKTDAPFWKKEETTEGEHWVESKSSDMTQKNRWT
jgi:molybdopterin synthase catalytic subunit